MNHINLDTLPEPVRQFIRSVAAGREGSVIEEGGRELAHVLPATKRRTGPPGDGKWTAAKNNRRCDLIDRDIDGTITPEERVELDDLQEQLRRYVNRVAPLSLEPLRKLHQELLEKAARAEGGPSA